MNAGIVNNQLNLQNQITSGTSSFRIGNQDKSFSSNERGLPSQQGIGLRQHYQQSQQAKQIYLPFI